MYDLEQIKSIPCEDICRRYGIELHRKGKRLWGKLRSGEKTESFAVTPEKNLWYDYGQATGGSGIELVATLENIERNKAINRIADMYGIQGEKENGWTPLTDAQYREIGIEAKRATMNFKIDLEKNSLEKVEYWNEKYGMSVQELGKKYPLIHDKMLFKKSIPLIINEKEKYYYLIGQYKKETGKIEKMLYIDKLTEIEASINKKVTLFSKGLTNNKDLSFFKVNIDEDLNNKSKIPNKFLGNIGYKELKSQGELAYREFNKEKANTIIQKLNNSDIKFAAFEKGENNINIAFKKNDIEKINNLFKSPLKEKEILCKT